MKDSKLMNCMIMTRAKTTKMDLSQRFIYSVKQFTGILIRPVSSAAMSGHQFLRAMDIFSLITSMEWGPSFYKYELIRSALLSPQIDAMSWMKSVSAVA